MQDNNKQLKRKVRNSYLISTISMALLLFLLGSVGYLILNAMKVSERVKENVVFNVMLKDDLPQDQIDALETKLSQMEEVREVKFVSKDEAAAEFIESSNNDFIAFLNFNPLPDVFEVGISVDKFEKEDLTALEEEILTWEEVREVVYQRNVVEQIGRNINKFNLILLLFGGALLVISVILLNNTIQITIYAKRYLINTMRLVGATEWFILRPFIGRSIWHGLQAGIIASLMFLAMIAGLHEGFRDIRFILDHTQIAIIIGAMLVLGMLLSMLFTVFSVHKFIRMPSQNVYFY